MRAGENTRSRHQRNLICKVQVFHGNVPKTVFGQQCKKVVLIDDIAVIPPRHIDFKRIISWLSGYEVRPQPIHRVQVIPQVDLCAKPMRHDKFFDMCVRYAAVMQSTWVDVEQFKRSPNESHPTWDYVTTRESRRFESRNFDETFAYPVPEDITPGLSNEAPRSR